MKPKFVGAFVATMLAIGILGGSASIVVARDAAVAQTAPAAATSCHQAGMGSMMSGSMMGHDPTSMPMDQSWHDSHQASQSPEVSK